MNNYFLLSFLYFAMLVWSAAVGVVPLMPFAIWLFIVFVAVFVVGDILLKKSIRDDDKFDNLPTKVVVGALSLNVLLYFLALVSPFGLTINFLIIVFFVVVLYLHKYGALAGATKNHTSESIIFIVAPFLVALWCQDFLELLHIRDKVAVLQVWQDVYYHLSQINMFSASSGAKTIFDVQMDGVVAHPYHHASYMLAALMVDAAGITSLNSYAAIYVPFGILLTAFAAYSLANLVFGKWPAVASGLGVLLLPDAFQQGFGNPYFSYHWLLQIGPAMGYGIAAAAIAFVFLFNFANTGKFIFVIFGYVFVGVCLLHKAHIFIAISYIAFVFPALVWRSKKHWYRVLLFVLLNLIYFSAVAVSQWMHLGPTLRLDGSNLVEYSSIVINMQAIGCIRKLFEQSFFQFEEGRIFIFPGYVTLVAFGIVFGLYLVQIRNLLTRLSPVFVMYPFVVLFIYLIMSTFLSYDANRFGAPEELLHRPFVLAYFVIVVWSVGGGYVICFGDNLPKGMVSRFWLIFVCFFLVATTYILGSGMQSNRIWGSGYQVFSVCKLNAARYIRENSLKGDVIQDSLNDPDFMLTAFSERRSYAIDSGGFREPLGLRDRLNSLDKFRRYTDPSDVEKFLMQTGIGWYIVSPEGAVAWGDYFKNNKVYECDGYSVYNFD